MKSHYKQNAKVDYQQQYMSMRQSKDAHTFRNSSHQKSSSHRNMPSDRYSNSKISCFDTNYQSQQDNDILSGLNKINQNQLPELVVNKKSLQNSNANADSNSKHSRTRSIAEKLPALDFNPKKLQNGHFSQSKREYFH